MKLIRKVHNWINKESPIEGEANGLIFLLRKVLLLYMIFYLFMGIFSLTQKIGMKAYATFLVGIIIYAGTFAETYRRSAKRCLYYTIISATIITGILTIIFGWRTSFHNFLYINFLMLWYDPTSGKIEKFISSVIMAVTMCIISAITPFGASVLTPGTVAHSTVVYANIILFFICLSFVAYYFCNLHIEAEHTLREYNRKLKQMSETDPLTKLMNRRFAEDELQEMIKDSQSNKYLVCIAIGDIDHFKKVNDTYGHDGGDFILSSLATMFERHMKGEGFVARWGGEEFLFVFPDMNGDEAMASLDELRIRIKETDFDYEGTVINVTMTFGIEEYSSMDGVDKTIASADKKLYIGKESGRDRVVF